MLNPGLIFIGAPSIHFHEMICLALCLNAPLAVSDENCFEIACRFKDLISVTKLGQELTLTLFLAGFDSVITNLQPYELNTFFLTHQEFKKIKVMHLLEGGIKIKPCPEGTIFCSSFIYLKNLLPLNAKWQHLGPVGYISFKKHKKALEKIFYSMTQAPLEANFLIAQIINDEKSLSINSEHLLDQAYFINLALSGPALEKKNNFLPCHGLIDIACHLCHGTIISSDELSTLSLFHKKPIISTAVLSHDYEKLTPLIALLPHLYQNIIPLIKHYFSFETIDRDEFIKTCYPLFYSKSLINDDSASHF